MEKRVESKLLSVVVPVYNGQENLKACIESICKQDYFNIEIIAVNDGSGDNSLQILQEMAQQDERIRVISQENRGVSSARNVGLQHAIGELVTFVDSDDLVEACGYSTIVEYMKKTDSDIAVYAFCRDYKDSFALDLLPWEDGTVLSNKEILKELIPQMIGAKKGARNISGSVCRSVFKRSLILGNRFDEEVRIQEDLLFCIKSYSQAERIVILNNVFYHYVKHASTTTEHYRNGYYNESLEFEGKIIDALIDIGVFNNIRERYWSKRIGMYSLCVSNLFRVDAPKECHAELKHIINGFRSDKYIANKFYYTYLNRKKLAIYLLLRFGTEKLISQIYESKEKRRHKKLSA